jgi:ribose 5-phosphate isomerase B
MIFLGCDHAGIDAKEKVMALLDGEYEDLGTFTREPFDYPDVAFKLAKKVASGGQGILVCRSGIGMAICANRIKGVRAAVCYTRELAKMGRLHNNINVLVLGCDHSDPHELPHIIETFLHTDFEGDTLEGERHKRRVEKFDTL